MTALFYLVIHERICGDLVTQHRPECEYTRRCSHRGSGPEQDTEIDSHRKVEHYIPGIPVI